jgi:hypothetical protein
MILSGKHLTNVIPAQAGIQDVLRPVSPLDSRLRGNDGQCFFTIRERRERGYL